MKTPTPFETLDHPIPVGYLAVCLIYQMKGVQLMQEIISEMSLEVYHLVKKDTLCMIIQDMEGGEPVGLLLSVMKASFKQQSVHVQCLNGTPSSEAALPFSRVILVNRLLFHFFCTLVPCSMTNIVFVLSNSHYIPVAP